MPAKLTIPRTISVSHPTTYLPLTSLNNGYLSGSMHLNTSGALVIDQAKLYFVALSVTIRQDEPRRRCNNNTNNLIVVDFGVSNTVTIRVYQNNATILEATRSYNETDDITIYTGAYVNLISGGVITASVSFAEPGNRITIRATSLSTFINVV